MRGGAPEQSRRERDAVVEQRRGGSWPAQLHRHHQGAPVGVGGEQLRERLDAAAAQRRADERERDAVADRRGGHGIEGFGAQGVPFSQQVCSAPRGGRRQLDGRLGRRR